MTTRSIAAPAALALAALLSAPVHADTYTFHFAGSGVSGSITLTYGTETDEKYSDAFVVTDISGTFSNATLGIVDAAVGPLVPVTQEAPHENNLLAPKNFSRFAVGDGLPPPHTGTISYDNLLWPAGSPKTASDYPFFGGKFDVYGLLFGIGGGRYVNLWSNGTFGGVVDYGVSVVTSAASLDYVGGVAAVPEPGTYALLGGGLLLVGFAAKRRRST